MAGRPPAPITIVPVADVLTEMTFCMKTERDACTRCCNTTALIEHNVLQGSHIMSDGLLAYGGIATMNGGVYMHDASVHERHFVQPDDEHILKKMLKTCGCVLSANLNDNLEQLGNCSRHTCLNSSGDRITRIIYLNNLLQRYVFYIMCDNLK